MRTRIARDFGPGEEARVLRDFEREIEFRLDEMPLGKLARHRDFLRSRVEEKLTDELVLLALPDALFLQALEAGLQCIDIEDDRKSQATQLDAVLRDHDLPYHFDRPVVRWSGGTLVRNVAWDRAIRVIEGHRLQVAASDLQHAFDDLRIGTPKARKSAVSNGTKALEGAMMALLESRGTNTPRRRQVWTLWETLRDHGCVPQTMMEVVLAGSRISNAKGRHTTPKDVTIVEAEASVAAVAVAVTYLGTLLPPERPV